VEGCKIGVPLDVEKGRLATPTWTWIMAKGFGDVTELTQGRGMLAGGGTCSIGRFHSDGADPPVVTDGLFPEMKEVLAGF
jgi:hypothetical protein